MSSVRSPELLLAPAAASLSSPSLQTRVPPVLLQLVLPLYYGMLVAAAAVLLPLPHGSNGFRYAAVLSAAVVTPNSARAFVTTSIGR